MKTIDLTFLKNKLELELQKNINTNLTLAIILANDLLASKKYIELKNKQAKKLGIDIKIYKFDKNSNNKEIVHLIDSLNNDDSINGIIVQLPLFNHLNENLIINSIDIFKDVDGLTNYNCGSLLNEGKGIIPATAKAVLKTLDYLNYNLKGKKVAIIGRGKLVSKPLINLLVNENCTLTIFHSKSVVDNFFDYDLVISAVGKPNIFDDRYFRDKQLIIDVGTSEKDSILVGDVDYKKLDHLDIEILKSPGGVGSLTILSLLENLLEISKW